MAGENLQAVIAGNIAALRRASGFTQAELAEKLGYSDKSVSKWERGDGLPDVLCLKAMADLFGVSVDYMLSADHPDGTERSVPSASPAPDAGNREEYQVNRRNIAALSVAGVWMLAALVYAAGLIAGKSLVSGFFLAVPVSAILLVVFASLWGSRTHLFLSVTLLVWGVLLLLCWLLRERNPWLLMTLGIPATVVVWLSCRVTTKKPPADPPDSPPAP